MLQKKKNDEEKIRCYSSNLTFVVSCIYKYLKKKRIILIRCKFDDSDG